MVICMHVHCIRGMRMLKRTSLGRRQRAVEKPATAAAGAEVRPRSPAVELLLLAATAASAWPPVRAGVGG